MSRSYHVSRMSSGMAVGLALLAAATTGCQIDVSGQTLPSPYYLQDDVQYFPAGPEFKLAKEAAAMKAQKEAVASRPQAR
jgi:hypothetical protein